MLRASLSKKNKLELRALRKELHHYPELAGEERKTAQVLENFLRAKSEKFCFERSVGGTGLLATLNFGDGGKKIGLRAELDALPIQELSDIAHRSRVNGKAHLCGHDGHMASICGAALMLLENPPPHGELALIFQPAEETGEGATRMLQDARLSNSPFDAIYCMHNIPGEALGTILIRAGTMALASSGLSIKLRGAETHAASPRRVCSPIPTIQALLQVVDEINESDREVLATVVGIECGGANFGIAPGEAELNLTVRSPSQERLAETLQYLRISAARLTKDFELEMTDRLVEPFQETVNDEGCLVWVEESANQLGLGLVHLDQPFPWSEDFGVFASKWPGALIGIGSGEDQPSLHDPYFDFPDELTLVSAEFFHALVHLTIQSNKEV